jgi:hypothetical protein
VRLATIPDAKGFVQNYLAIAAEAVSSAPILAKQIFAEIIGGRLSGLLTLELFSNRITHKVREADAAQDNMHTQVSFQLLR